MSKIPFKGLFIADFSYKYGNRLPYLYEKVLIFYANPGINSYICMKF